MIRHLRFRRKVSLFFLLVLAAFAVNAVQAISHYTINQSSWQRDHLTRQVSILIHQIDKSSDHANQEVEAFLRTKDAKIGERVIVYLQEILPRLQELDELGVVADRQSVLLARERIGEQLELFRRIQGKLLEIGLNENSGEHGRIRTRIHQVEQWLQEARAFDVLSSMLQLRRHEKDFMERKQILYLERFNVETERFQSLLSQAGVGERRQELQECFLSYAHGFYTIVSDLLVVTQWIEKYRQQVLETAEAVQGLLDALDEVYKRHDAQQNEALFDQFLRSQLTSLLVLLAIGLLLSWFQYDLLHAVNQLSAVARRVAGGEDPPIVVERRDEVGELASSLKVMQDSLTARHRELEEMVRELQESERENARALDLRSAISTILQQSLLSLTLEEILRKALQVVLSVPWLGVEQRGAIFLYNDGNARLELTVHHALSPALLEMCRSIPLGHCLCGRAGESREVVMSADLDARHEVRFEGMTPHGHYCVPIVSERHLLGVLNVYLAPGHIFDDDEVVFLRNIADTLAGLISRRRAEQKLTQLLATLDAKVVERTRRLNEKIRELEDTRHELIAKEKLASLGRLVAGIAHEVNTPIGVAYSASTQLLEECRLLDRMLEQDEVDVDELISGIRVLGEVSVLVVRNLQRAAELIQSFKRASTDQSSEAMREYRVIEVAGDVLMSLRNVFKKTDIDIHLECPEGLRVVGVPGYLNQILTNFLLNSLTHGFEEGGRSGRIDLAFRIQGQQLELEYIDNGVGMSEEARHKAFEPFFTTNRGAGGSGLGLYICYNLITTKLRGSILLRSEPGAGVRFLCRWPVDLKGFTAA
ncbi:MAG: GAF domain-containing protein [Magnetococcales bacterium]|nr:GAF domain-containing protein [Magnetococcales bacterium]